MVTDILRTDYMAGYREDYYRGISKCEKSPRKPDNSLLKSTTNCVIVPRRNGYSSFKLHGETDFSECWRKFNIQEHMGIDSTFSTTQNMALLMRISQNYKNLALEHVPLDGDTTLLVRVLKWQRKPKV